MALLLIVVASAFSFALAWPLKDFFFFFGVFNVFKVMTKLFYLNFFKGLGNLFYVKLVDWV